ncbi:DUF3566 domain-containing protein [Kribbella italica]|uniref:DUF3566 domain-containing protein n=1 Tax=Kribbella italica TaxID=1540520 RepID=A0A7W9JBT6_9ACTN|nr:DUF3566 domain-containing protein [Kribbella italica]MBB5839256.1 hypothetical protein [Kribbella italica]
MTNRSRPNWPDGADSAKSRPPQSGNGKAASTPPATPASNGRTNGSQPRPASPNGPADPRSGDPRAAGRPAAQPGTPARPPQQPPVRPVSKPAPAPSQAGRPAPSTPGRPEQRLPSGGTAGSTPGVSPARTGSPARATGTPVGGAGAAAKVGTTPATPSYGQTGKVSTPGKGESFGDRVSAAKAAVLEKAAAVKDAAADKTRAAEDTEPVARSRGQVRKARLRLSRVDPWSVMKTAFLLSIAFGIVTWVAVFIVWSAIGAAGVFDNINNTVTEVLGTPAAEPFDIENYVNTGKVMGFTTLLACADVLIITALATLGSFLYNIAATLLGGLEVTLASED